MKRILPMVGLLSLGMMSWSGFGQGDIRRFELQSKAVGAPYAIEVVLPSGAAASGSKYPALYITDWFILADYFKSLPRLMDMGRLTEPFILVGISQPGKDQDWAAARTRDFTPARPADEYSKRNTYADAIELAGGAARFAAFLKEELIPKIESSYPADPARRGFAGYSLGALFGTFLLARDPELFQYYLLGSASLWYNEYGLALELEKTAPDRFDSISRIYLSVGEEESWEMLKGFGMLRDTLSAKGLKGPRMKADVILEAGHVGAMPISFCTTVSVSCSAGSDPSAGPPDRRPRAEKRMSPGLTRPGFRRIHKGDFPSSEELPWPLRITPTTAASCPCTTECSSGCCSSP